MSEEKQEVLAAKIKRAKDLLDEIEVLVEHKYWNSAINRLYYACFYAVSALLANDDVFVKTHSGLKQMFSLHYIKTKKVADEVGEFYSELFEMRQSADYEDAIDYEESSVLTLIGPAKELIFLIDEMIKKG